MTASDEYLRPADVAAEFGISTGTLKSWRHDKYGPKWIPLGRRRICYRRSEVERFVAECEQAAS